jgi:pimeloyl-ACP methyl ester carboxylesterase
MSHSGTLSSASLSSARCERHNVTVTGSNGPLLVLLHGFGTDQTVWRKVLPSLEPHFQILRMDLAGAGPKGPANFDPSRYDHIESHADDLLLVLDELGIDQCTFVGASVGSMVGFLASLERSKLFRKIITIGASPRYLNDGPYIGGFEQEHLDQIYAAMNRDYQGWISGFAPLAVRGLPDSAPVKEFPKACSHSVPILLSRQRGPSSRATSAAICLSSNRPLCCCKRRTTSPFLTKSASI